jgi:hypothetical protein
MEFTTTEEKRITPAQTYTSPAREFAIVKIYGPCLVCEREMEYAGRWPYSEDHARNQFKPARRNRMLKKLREGGWDGGDAPQVETIEKMVCPDCIAECRTSREAAERERKEEQRRVDARKRDKERRVEENRLARVHHYEWRTATAEEVDPTPQATEFRAVFPKSKAHHIVFRWRAVPGKCRGDSYLTKVGMWVDGKLTAHYYGWNLQDIEVDDDIAGYFYASEDDWPTEDLFARGFCRWIERAFQPGLLRLTPDHVWVPGYKELETEVARPGTLLVEWMDGTRYVHILHSMNLPEVAEWAEQHLDLRIEERAFRPVQRSKAAAEDDEEE